MSDMAMNGQVPESASLDTAAQTEAMLDAMTLLAQKSAATQSAAEAKDFAGAVLAFSQAIVVLDPGLNQQGVPLDHEMAMEELRQDGQERIEKARAAAAPTPAKRKLRRTADGYEMEG